MQTSQRNIYTGIGLAVLTAIIWSGNFIIARGVYKQIPPVSLAFYRWALATVIIFPFAIRKFKSEWPTIKKSWQYLFWISLFGITLFNTLVYVGAHYIPAIDLALIGTTSSPIMATILARIFLKEQIGWTKLAGLFLCIIGVFFLLCKGDFGYLLSLKFSTGDFWILAAALCFAVYTIMVKKKPVAISSLNFLFVIFALGSLLLLPFFIWEINNSQAVIWTPYLFRSIAYLGLGTSVICFWMWNVSIGKLGAARTALFSNLIPIFSSIGAAIFLDEQFTWVHIVSMLIVFAGIVLANLRLVR
jgi:drug/metabolite transporter (DMT)-like permease